MRKAETEKVQEDKMKKKREEWFEIVDRYIQLKLTKTEKNVSKWTNSELKIAIKALKEDSDGKMPSKKSDMIAMWDKIKEREEKTKIDHERTIIEMTQEENMD